jgi:threonylcarbamoyladenosine tRNA methylthiotransferase MtaB
MQSLFEQSGFETVAFEQDADIVVVNTCTVTAVADKKSRAAIRRAARVGHVIVVGCLAQRAADEILAIDGVSAVVGTDERGRIVEVAQKLLDGEKAIDLTHDLIGCGFEPMQVNTSGDRTRGVLKIQEGCDCFCSYCIIPYVRGRSRSRGFDDILKEADAMVQSSVKEIVLTGIHIASYNDNERSLGELIQALDGCGARLRIGSIEPGVLGDDFIEKAASAKNLCPHFHLSLQSGCAAVLKRMNRPYTPEEYLSFVTLLRRGFDNPAITTDVITGFPAETDAEHMETMAFVEKAAFARIHVFPFSARDGTRAFSMKPRVTKAVSKQRAAELIQLGEMLEDRYIQNMIGRDAQVLFEEPSEIFDGCMEGYSERYVRVAAAANRNELKTVTLSEKHGKTVLSL